MNSERGALFIPPSVLEAFRAVQEANMPHSVDLYTMRVEDAGAGVMRNVPELTQSGIAARVTALSEAERVAQAQVSAAVEWLVVMPAGTVVRSDQVLHALVDGLTRVLYVVHIAGPYLRESALHVYCHESADTVPLAAPHKDA